MELLYQRDTHLPENVVVPVAVSCISVRADKMRVLVFLCVCLIAKQCVSSEMVVVGAEKTCNALYRQGIEAYLEERWQDCIDNLERALSSYRLLKQKTVNCRLMCRAEVDESSALMSAKNIDDLQFFEKMIRKTLCLIKCNKHNPKDGMNGLPKSTIKEFEDLKPYEYLQLCYYQVREMLSL
jgi:hypothetical protein